MAEKENKSSIQVIERMMHLIDALAQSPSPVNLKHLATATQLHPSTAHRTAASWTFGFPELESSRRLELRSSKRVSNPGCYSTGFIALARPLVRAGLVPADWAFTCNAVSGYSGGGRAMIAEIGRAHV